ncbi:MAG: hypothetical protein HYX63_07515 [Gammaproteobacteria bacterium]|nr:hypothetical protein [Gammaproteobacteria bacterium]
MAWRCYYDATSSSLEQRVSELRFHASEDASRLREEVIVTLGTHRTAFEARQATMQQTQTDALQSGFRGLHQRLADTLLRNSSGLGSRVDALTRATVERLREIASQVDR